tara:strand:+ start:18677 stop:18781 length:105 start_codon:yes stop_codon:yes gene_type:complete
VLLDKKLPSEAKEMTDRASTAVISKEIVIKITNI